MDTKHKRPYNEVLQELDAEDSVSITSNRQTYYLVTSLSHQPGYDSEKKGKKQPNKWIVLHTTLKSHNHW